MYLYDNKYVSNIVHIMNMLSQISYIASISSMCYGMHMAATAQHPITLPKAEQKRVEELDALLSRGNAALVSAGTHNAYHVGQIIFVRKLQGSWNPSMQDRFRYRLRNGVQARREVEEEQPRTTS
jgi:hypothetical protein